MLSQCLQYQRGLRSGYLKWSCLLYQGGLVDAAPMFTVSVGPMFRVSISGAYDLLFFCTLKKWSCLQYQRGLVDATLRSLMLCPLCRSPMVEDQSSRFLQPMVCIRLISLNALKSQNSLNSLMHQTIDVFIRTEKLWKQVHLGDAFIVEIWK